jgi:hypothetical protein
VRGNKVLLDKKLRLQRMPLDITRMREIKSRKELSIWMNWKVKLDHLDHASTLPHRPRLRNEP